MSKFTQAIDTASAILQIVKTVLIGVVLVGVLAGLASIALA